LTKVDGAESKHELQNGDFAISNVCFLPSNQLWNARKWNMHCCRRMAMHG